MKLETYEILLAIWYYKVYLYGRKFIILSHCKSFNYLIKVESPAGRLSCWLLDFFNYDFEFHYIKGSTNFLGDLLSRNMSHSVNVFKAAFSDFEIIWSEERADLFLETY